MAALYDALAEAATKAKKASGQTTDVPLWMLEGAMEYLKLYIPAARTKQASGPNNRWVEQFRRDTIDWHRCYAAWFDLVLEDDNRGAPGEHPSWRLAVKAGRDGKDAR